MHMILITSLSSLSLRSLLSLRQSLLMSQPSLRLCIFHLKQQNCLESVIRVVLLFFTCSLGAEHELLLRVAPSKLVPGPDLDPVHGGLAQPGDGVQAPGHPAPGPGLLVPRHSGVQGVGVPGVQQRLVQSLKRRLNKGLRRLAQCLMIIASASQFHIYLPWG